MRCGVGKGGPAVPEILDILHTEFVPGNFNDPGPITTWGSFVADNTVAELGTDVSVAAFHWTFQQATGNYKFQANDNIMILSAAFLPGYQYGLSRGAAPVLFGFGNDAGIGIIGEIATPTGTVALPVAGAEIAIGVYVPYRRYGGGADYMSLGMTLLETWISQIGGPAILNGVTIYPSMVLKVLHSLEMIP